MQDVEQLALVLMQALDLDIENGIRVDAHAVLVLDESGEALLVLALDGHEVRKHLFVILIWQELLECAGIPQEVAADELLEIIRQQRIGLAQPTAIGDAVRHVQEALRRDLTVVTEDAVAQDVRVQLGNAVDLVAGGKAEIRHADLVVRDDGHVVDLAPVVRVDGAQVLDEAAVDLLTDGVDARQLLTEQIDVPALKRLAHNGVVRIGQRAAGDVPRLVPAEVVLIDEQAHQLRHTQGRMGVVDVDGDLFRQVRVGAVFLIVLLQDALQRGGDEQVLLL